jgi:hypothetical protein
MIDMGAIEDILRQMVNNPTFARFAIIILVNLEKKARIVFIKHPGRATPESIYRITMEKRKLTR